MFISYKFWRLLLSYMYNVHVYLRHATEDMSITNKLYIIIIINYNFIYITALSTLEGLLTYYIHWTNIL